MSHPFLPEITEAEFQTQFIQYARLQGFLVAHFRTSRTQRADGSVFYETPVQADGKGFPDLVLTRPGRLVFVELKAERGRTSLGQDRWINALKDCGQEVYVFRPGMWKQIEQILGK